MTDTVAAIDRSFEWDETQLAAIDRACDMQQRIVPITGVAGTGKTTIIREVYKRLQKAGYRCVLCAPTGKAAKRITEATGIPAMTLHRLLEYPHPGERDPKTGKALISTIPKRDKRNPLDYDVILADEYAMVNREVHRNLIDALPAAGRVCMFGDMNQLKPIEPGKFRDVESPFQAALRKFDGIVLERIHRQQEGSGIALNGERILRGRVPQRTHDFNMRITERPVEVLEDVVMEFLTQHDINFGTNQGQIISCTKRSWVGTYKLNIMLQNLLNPLRAGARIPLKRQTWDKNMPIQVGIGDKVIWTENAYDLRNPWEQEDEDGDYIPCPAEKTIMNGESGIVVAIHEDGGIDIDVGDRVVEVPHEQSVMTQNGAIVQIDPRVKIDLGFVVTTHKAQGSEWPHVIYIMNKTGMAMQSRHNLYTGISRARESVTLVTDSPSLQNSVFQRLTVIERQELARNK
jgi:exodeoxyribonuclease V alpha subunit